MIYIHTFGHTAAAKRNSANTTPPRKVAQLKDTGDGISAAGEGDSGERLTSPAGQDAAKETHFALAGRRV